MKRLEVVVRIWDVWISDFESRSKAITINNIIYLLSYDKHKWALHLLISALDLKNSRKSLN